MTNDNKPDLEELETKAKAGDANAQNDLGVMYFEGYRVEQDEKKGLELFRKAADQGVSEAQYNLGFIYLIEGAKPDYDKAFKLIEKAANQGYAPAEAKIGSMYAEGEGVAQDHAKAAKWFMKALRRGSPEHSKALHMGLRLETYRELFNTYEALDNDVKKRLKVDSKMSAEGNMVFDEKAQLVADIAKFIKAIQRNEEPSLNSAPDPASGRK